jgi:hypothetical protein
MFGQAKLLSTSTYDFNSTTSLFEPTDSTKYFYASSNPTNSNQNYEDGYVSNLADSFWNVTPISNAFKARAFYKYNPGYTHTTQYDDTIYNSGTPSFAYHTDYYHNGTNYDSSITKQTTFTSNNTVIPYKYFYHQNAQNLIDTLWSVYFNASGVYTSSSKQGNTYNANNDILSNYTYNSTDSINYTPDSRVDYYYGATNLLDSMVVFAYQTNTWIKVGKRNYLYNASNQKTTMEYKGFDALTNTYQAVVRDQYLRNNGIQMDSLYSQLWSTGNLKYDTTVKRGFIYSNGLLTKAYSYNYDVVTSTWKPNPYGAIHNYYYDVPQDVEHVTKEKTTLRIYPNPVKDNLYFVENYKHATYTVLSTDGKLLLHGMLDNNNSISTKTLSHGSYILMLETNDDTSSTIFMK